MCYGCWQDAGFPYIVNDATRQAVYLIGKVDNYGNLHIVVDDWNMEDECIEACRRDVLSAMTGKPVPKTCTLPEILQAELACADHLLSMTEDERYSAMAMVEGYTPELRARNND